MNYEGYYSMLLLGNALIGIGAVPSFTLGLTYIEENSKVRSSPFYFGNLNCNWSFLINKTLSLSPYLVKVIKSLLYLQYIQDNAHNNWFILFWIGCTFCSAAVGVAVGYIAGAQTLSIFVDVDKIDTSKLDFSIDSTFHKFYLNQFKCNNLIVCWFFLVCR